MCHYEPPIDITVTMHELYNSLESSREDQIVMHLKENYAIEVNKEELIKALQYDRSQYDKGFRDGQNSVVGCRRYTAGELQQASQKACKKLLTQMYDELKAMPDMWPEYLEEIFFNYLKKWGIDQ